MKRDFIFDKWWGIAVGVFVLAFGLWFAIDQSEGLVTFFEFLLNTILVIPQSVRTVIDYYGTASSQTVALSVLIGALVGAVLIGLAAYRPQTDLRRIGLLMAVGAAAGAFGSQLLTYPMQHCTYLPEAETVERQLGYLITGVGGALPLLPLWLMLRGRGAGRNVSTAGYFKSRTLPLLFLLPTLVFLLVFLYYPAVQIAVLSLRARRFRQEAFVCLGNYVDLATDTIYRNSFITTLTLTIAIVVFAMSVALAIAVLASQKVRGASIYRTLLIWPYAISPVVTGAIFVAMFRQNRSGLINYLLYELFGLSPEWFTDARLAPWVIIFASVWNVLGFNILFYIAGLQNVPKDLLEAAEIDGANRLQRFFRITIPLLSPFTFFLLVTNVTFSFYGIYGAVDTLTQGGPPVGPAGQAGGATNVLIYKLYEDGFAAGAQVGSAAAQSVILFLLVAALTFFQFRVLERRVTYAD